MSVFTEILVVIVLLLSMFPKGFSSAFDTDDTDSPDSRSGLRVYTDAKTGVQYLQAGPLGALTPRIDANGRVVTVTKGE